MSAALKEILARGIKVLEDKKIKSATLDAEILLLYSLTKQSAKPSSSGKTVPIPGRDRAWLYAHPEYNITKRREKKFLGAISRRARFEPVAYITGKKEFYGLDFLVNKNALIPRPETEIIVEESLKEILPILEKNKKLVIADIGTGSGAIAVSMASGLKSQGRLNRVKIYATDISQKALALAKINARKYGLKKNIVFKTGDLLKALPKNIKVDFLLANLPYVKNDYYYKWLKNGSRSSEFSEIKHEPKKSLLAKNNGLEYFDKFFPLLPGHTAKETKIFLESDPCQIPAIKKLAKKYLPKHKISVIKDLRGLDRITKIEIIQ